MQVTPLLTNGFGRTGSTILMELLGTSPAVEFDRDYPYEKHIVTGLVQAALLFHELPDEWQQYPGTIKYHLETLVPKKSIFFTENAGGQQGRFWCDLLQVSWERICDRLLGHNHGCIYYAEKSFPLTSVALEHAGIGFRSIVRVRDPRDIWCSVLSFDEKRGYYGFGRTQGESEMEYLERYIAAMKVFYSPSLFQAMPAIWIRYEDLVQTPQKTVRDLGEWLHLDLSWENAEKVSSGYRHHMTSHKAAASIGKWHEEIDRTHLELIEEGLSDFMKEWGYL